MVGRVGLDQVALLPAWVGFDWFGDLVGWVLKKWTYGHVCASVIVIISPPSIIVIAIVIVVIVVITIVVLHPFLLLLLFTIDSYVNSEPLS